MQAVVLLAILQLHILNTMRKFTVTLATLLSLTLTALAGDGPAAAEKTLGEQYPKAEEISWSKESANNYQAAFLYSGVKTWVNFNEDGKILQIKTTIPVAQIPGPIFDFAKKNFDGAVVLGGAKVVKPSSDLVLYEVEIKSNTGTQKVLLNDQGVKVKQ